MRTVGNKSCKNWSTACVNMNTSLLIKFQVNPGVKSFPKQTSTASCCDSDADKVSLGGSLINLQTKMWHWTGLCNNLSMLTWISIQPLLLCANVHGTTSAEHHSLFHRGDQEQQYNAVSRGDSSTSQLKCWNLNTRRSSRHKPSITYFWNRLVTARSTVFQNCESFALDGEKKHSSACSNHKKMHWATGKKWLHLMVFQRKYSTSQIIHHQAKALQQSFPCPSRSLNISSIFSIQGCCR